MSEKILAPMKNFVAFVLRKFLYNVEFSNSCFSFVTFFIRWAQTKEKTRDLHNFFKFSILAKSKVSKCCSWNNKKDVGMYAKVYGTASGIKQFSSKYARFNFNRTTVNSWKARYKVANPTFKKAGRPNLLDETLL